MKKIISIILAVVLMFAFSACSQKPNSNNVVTVKLVAEGRFFAEGTAFLDLLPSNACDPVINYCQENKIVYRYNNGLYDGFGGVNSTGEEGWLLYINDKLAKLGADEEKVNHGDTVEFRYVNYEIAFAEQPMW